MQIKGGNACEIRRWDGLREDEEEMKGGMRVNMEDGMGWVA